MAIAATHALTPLNTLATPCAKPLLWFALLVRIKGGKLKDVTRRLYISLTTILSSLNLDNDLLT